MPEACAIHLKIASSVILLVASTMLIELVERAKVKGDPQRTPLDEEQAERLRGSEGWAYSYSASASVELSGTEHKLRFSMRSVIIGMLLESQIRPESAMIGRQRSE